MAAFQLLSVLGNGSGKIATHHRFPLAAYQSGSILVLWDYVRSGGASRKLVHLQANQRLSSLFFSKDASCLLGFWLSQESQPMLTVWRVADGTKISEHGLSDRAGCSRLFVDFHTETSHIVVAHAGPASSASVIFWDGNALRPHYVAFGHIGMTDELLGVKLLEDGNHFVSASRGEVKFWAFTEQQPRLVLKVDLSKPISAFDTSSQLVYLLPECGRLRIMNLEGNLEPLSIAPSTGDEPSLCFTAVAVRSSLLCLGLENGSLRVYRQARLELWKQIQVPQEVVSCEILHVAFGMNEDYVSVVFADASYGIVHLESSRYVALRVGHRSAVHTITMAPHLHLPPGRLLDSEHAILSRTIAFVSLSGDKNWLTWPRLGAPARSMLECPARPPAPRDDRGLALEIYIPKPQTASDNAFREPPASITAAAFHPSACLSSSGHLPGAYRMLVGTQDGFLHILTTTNTGRAADPEGPAQDAVSPILDWQPAEEGGVVRVRPPCAELTSSSLGDVGSACCHVTFSQCGKFASVCFANGFAEVVHFPALTRTLIVQNLDGPCPGAQQLPLDYHLGAALCAKSAFIWHPSEEQRAYDRNQYLLSHTLDPRELVLYELYMLGGAYAKSSIQSFLLPQHLGLMAVGASSGHRETITDFCVHPSQSFLVVGAVLPALQSRSMILVYDLWAGNQLKTCPVFDSLLVTPLAPLRPSLSIDATGSFIACASTPMLVHAPLDKLSLRPQHLAGMDGRCGSTQSPGPGVVTDSVLRMSRGHQTLHQQSAPSSPSASVICLLDFSTGQCIYQSTAEISCLLFGALAHDATQLLFGAHDGTISVWGPPEAVSQRIQDMLQASRQEYMASRSQEGVTVESLDALDLEFAIAAYWKQHLSLRIDWERWADTLQMPRDGYADQAHSLRHKHDRMQALNAGPQPGDHPPAADVDGDVVVQARQSWLAGGGQTVSVTPAMMKPKHHPEVAPAPGRPAHAAPGISHDIDVRHAEWDPVSGLELKELPGDHHPVHAPWRDRGVNRQAHQQTFQRHNVRDAAGDVEVVVSAPEFNEEFGSLPEHSEDPLADERLRVEPRFGQQPRIPQRHPVDKLVQSRALLAEHRNFVVVESVFDALDQFEKVNLGVDGAEMDDSDEESPQEVRVR